MLMFLIGIITLTNSHCCKYSLFFSRIYKSGSFNQRGSLGQEKKIITTNAVWTFDKTETYAIRMRLDIARGTAMKISIT